jgi:hypothetical protein
MEKPASIIHADGQNTNSSVLDLQLEFLKLEVQTVTSSIRQMDELSKSIKQWAITLWTGAVGGALVNSKLTPYIAFTAIIPLLFWFVEGQYRRIQQMFIWRTDRIRDFLNDSDGLESCFKDGQVAKFKVFDPAGRTDEKEEKYQDFVHWTRPLGFISIAFLYICLILISVSIGIGWKLAM